MSKISENFSRKEFECQCGCGFDTVDVELVKVLEDIRKTFNSTVIITGPNRCVSHNKKIGGSVRSKHTLAQAADFKVSGVHEDKVVEYLEKKYPDKYGIGRYVGRTHIDIRNTKARWDNRRK